MEYTVRLTEASAKITGLPSVYLHFAHHDFDIVWNEKSRTQDVVRGVNKFFGGSGEGRKFDTWQLAIHSSLYDAYQVSDELHDGDTFTVSYKRQVAKFACEGVHVVKLEQIGVRS